MAITTEKKRRSALGFLLMPWIILPTPDSEIDSESRAGVMGVYDLDLPTLPTPSGGKMVRYFEWNAAGTMKVMDSAAVNKRFRIFAAPMSCNAFTTKAILHEGSIEPVNGDHQVIDFVDSVRTSNGSILGAPYIGQQRAPIFLTTAESGGPTSGRGMILYLEETV